MNNNKTDEHAIFGPPAPTPDYNPFDSSFPPVNSTPAYRESNTPQQPFQLQQPQQLFIPQEPYTASSVPISASTSNDKDKRFTYNLSKDDFYRASGTNSNPHTHYQEYSETASSSSSDLMNKNLLTHDGRSVFKLPVFILFIITAIASLALFVTTCAQFGNNTSTDAGSQLYSLDGGDPCAILPYRPARFTFNNDPGYLYCTWTTSSNVARFFFTLFSVAWPVFGFWTTLKKKRMLNWIFALVAVVATIGWFLMMCSDANDVRLSDSWCNAGLDGIKLPDNTQITCAYLPFAGMCLGEAGLFLVWLVCTGMTIRYLRKTG